MANDSDSNQALAVAQLELDDGRRVVIRQAEEDDTDALIRIGGSAAEAFQGTGAGYKEQHAMLVATTHDGRVIGTTWLEIDEHQPAQAQLRLALESGYRQLGLEAGLVQRVAVVARERGCQRLTAYVPYLSSDVLACFRAANMRIVSCLALGGTAEVVLELR